jgi:hypothetical protein
MVGREVIAALRASFVAIQRHATHARIGEVIGTRVTKKGEVVPVTRPSRMVCPSCAVRKECRRVSLELARAEADVIGRCA